MATQKTMTMNMILIVHRFTFNNKRERVVMYLKNNNLKFDEGGISVYGIYEDDDNFKEITTFLKSEGLTPTLHCHYTEQELDEAEWLYVWGAWSYDYPQPANLHDRTQPSYLDSTYV